MRLAWLLLPWALSACGAVFGAAAPEPEPNSPGARSDDGDDRVREARANGMHLHAGEPATMRPEILGFGVSFALGGASVDAGPPSKAPAPMVKAE